MVIAFCITDCLLLIDFRDKNTDSAQASDQATGGMLDMLIFCDACGKVNFLKKEKIPEGASRTPCIHCGSEIPIPESFESEADTGPPTKKNSRTPDVTPLQRTDRRPYPGIHGLSFRLLMPFILILLCVSASIAYAYYKAVPAIIEEQINQRAFAISRSFSAAVAQPLLLKNYLAVSQAASVHADLPGVAYVVVQNHDKAIVTGIFGLLSRFDEDFARGVTAGGFPPGLVQLNPIAENESISARNILVGKRRIHDVAIRIRTSGGIVHVGLFMEDAENAVRRSLRPLMVVLSALFIAGGAALWWITASIANPIRNLTRVAHAIAIGELDTPVHIRGKGEIADLGQAIETMRISVRSAILRLRNRQRVGKNA
jgi:HAMP domain-containing protein